MAEREMARAPIAAPHLAFLELKPELISTTIGCQHPECSSTAVFVDVVTNGTPHPDDKKHYRELLETSGGGSGGIIIIKGYLQNFAMPLSSEEEYDQAADALRSGDIAALYAMNRNFAPFYCLRCPGVFCVKHFGFRAVWDEAGLDYWTGDCPYGHGKFVDH